MKYIISFISSLVLIAFFIGLYKLTIYFINISKNRINVSFNKISFKENLKYYVIFILILKYLIYLNYINREILEKTIATTTLIILIFIILIFLIFLCHSLKVIFTGVDGDNCGVNKKYRFFLLVLYVITIPTLYNYDIIYKSIKPENYYHSNLKKEVNSFIIDHDDIKSHVVFSYYDSLENLLINHGHLTVDYRESLYDIMDDHLFVNRYIKKIEKIEGLIDEIKNYKFHNNDNFVYLINLYTIKLTNLQDKYKTRLFYLKDLSEKIDYEVEISAKYFSTKGLDLDDEDIKILKEARHRDNNKEIDFLYNNMVNLTILLD